MNSVFNTEFVNIIKMLKKKKSVKIVRNAS